MAAWEYVVVPLEVVPIDVQAPPRQRSSYEIHQKTLNELGQNGWELVSVWEGRGYLKRLREG